MEDPGQRQADQLDLFSADAEVHRAARALMAELRFTDAVRLLEGRALYEGVLPLARALAAVPRKRSKLGAYEHLLACAAVEGVEGEPWLRSKILAGAAAALETARGEGGAQDGVTAGSLWLEAGATNEAVRSLAATIRARPDDTESRLLLGMAHHQAGERDAAREAWMLALWHDPLGVEPDAIPDQTVLDLFDQAEELVPDDDGDPRLWVVALGLACGVFHATGQLEVEPDLLGVMAPPEDRARLVAGVLMAGGRGPENIAARRAIKRYAPWLLPFLLGSR